MSYIGGYYMIKNPLIKTGNYEHTNALPRPVPQAQLDALNRIQETAWRINTPVAAVFEEAVNTNSTIAGLPPMEPLPHPARFSDENWEALSKDEKRDHKMERERIHSLNAKALCDRESSLRRLFVARHLADRNFWFPHNIDWRGRAYALASALNLQQDDNARGLLEFGEGRPLGDTGMYHLVLKGSAAFGEDKISFDDRVQWFLNNEALILDSARDPLNGERFWCEADEPWQFLSTCIAWQGYVEQGESYVCHLPIPFDATCSGLQHLSAMGLSEFGGRMVNLTDDPNRQDVYQVVADHVAELVRADLGKVEEAGHWHGKVERKTVKRQTMTLCYGATPIGMRNMLSSDGHLDDLAGSPSANAHYLTSKILKAIDSVLTEGAEIMSWMQESAFTIASHECPIQWTTPIGMDVLQAYYNVNERRILTLIGQTTIVDEDKDMGINPRLMKQGIVPNVIHSFDAAHMSMTVNRAVELTGEELAWGTVHDSFATWAGSTTTSMNRAIRETFMEIYEQDQLGLLYEQMSASGVPIKAPPARGALDITKVLNSQYFFS